MAATRFFYVVCVPAGELRSCLDAIRLFCDPAEKHCAHITVKGPYDQPQDLGHAQKKVKGSRIKVAGAGSFFNPGQNTVFLSCKCPKLEEVWDKRDFGFNPHITMYDGPSREVANALLKMLRQHPFEFSFTAEELSPLVSIKGVATKFSLRDHVPNQFISSILGEHVEAHDLAGLHQDIRLWYAERVCRHLSEKLAAERPTNGTAPSVRRSHPLRTKNGPPA